ncbi:MAG: Asp-tRNA(Asn)/Glu-tRNA(Gln) amidotransferase subunit GatB [Nitrospinota bacterium]|nr:Asp-tRNA(Asn)/Glu-tRNA(Gln) amidotransferase subunit GatB [Nitrospinota bacterium]
MEYEVVIGLEVHAQLNTRSKIFCGCSAEYGGEPNSHTCPICAGMPGVLPVLNKEVVRKAMQAALATECSIAEMSIWARKNYFYPDLPKGYQISQFELPIAQNGKIEVFIDGQPKTIRINRIHMEEDAGKSIHGENFNDPAHSYVDLNRTGVPLIEIVSEADMNSSEEAKQYLTKLKTILQYINVSDCNMEEGSLRADLNLSIRPKGQKEFGTKVEVKNMNSFRFLQRAAEYEIERQKEILEDGGRIVQETRLFDSDKGITISMRSKEEANDYRYFPDPDLVPLRISQDWIGEVRKGLPELPDAKRERFVKDYGIPPYDAEVLTAERETADYFEEVVKGGADAKAASNWIMTDVLRILKEKNIPLAECPVKAGMLAEMLALIKDGTISGKIAKTVFAEMELSGKNPKAIIEEKGLVQVSDSGAIEKIVDSVIAANPKQLEQYRGGKEQLLGFFVGQVMKESKGKANPGIVNDLLKKKLSG